MSTPTNSTTHLTAKQTANEKQQIRKTIRKRRKNLTSSQQQAFAKQIASHVLTQTQLTQTSLSHSSLSHASQSQSQSQPQKVALFLSIDGEIGTTDAIQTLWDNGCEVYLPRIHPFNPQQLIFLRYQANTPLIKSPLGMDEPQLNCQQLCPVNQLDIIFTPLVAFDAQGHRLGMGGGFYDRTLAPLYESQKTPQLTNKKARTNSTIGRIIGLAHNCQQVEQVPTESWDLPLAQIITPEGPILDENQSI